MPERSSAESANNVLLIIIFILAISLAGPGCTGTQGQQPPDSNKYEEINGDVEETWWDHYERALLFADGKLYRKAEKELQKSIKGNDFDQWQAVINNAKVIGFFPHRELGVIYYQRQEYIKAIAELEYSIESSPSAKAFFYLNKARAAKIAREERDLSPPELVLETSTAKEVTNSFTKSLKGVAMDDNYVASIQVNDMRIPMELAKKSHVFTAEVLLSEGENTILARATDLAGKTTENTLQIYCDRRGPLVEIMETDLRDNDVTIRGRASDTGGLVSLRINGRKWPVSGAYKGYNFKFAQPLGPITITASDRAGNVTQVTLRENELATDGGKHQKTGEGPKALPLSGQPAPADTVPPRITLEDLVSGHETFDDSIMFKVSISDSSDIHSIFVNTEPVLNVTGKKIFFSLLKKLEEGDNEFHFIVFDLHGNKTDKKIIITRKVRKIDRTDSRMSIVLGTFELQGSGDPSRLDVPGKMSALLAELQRFQIINRMKTGQPVQQSAPVNAMLTGTITSSADHVEIFARLADANTKETITTHDVFGKITSPEGLDILLKNLARKFYEDFPVIRGRITDFRGRDIIINLGTTQGIKPYTWLIFYRDAPPFTHPLTGTLIEPDPDILGMLQVKEVFENFSRARLVESSSAPQKYDRVMVR